MPLGKSKLPEGMWRIGTETVKRGAPRADAFLLVARDLVTGDRAEAGILTEAHPFVRGERGLWPSAAAQGDRVLFFDCLFPRRARASGGFEALVRGIGEVADAAGAWVVTRCGARYPEDDAIIQGIFREHGGFVEEERGIDEPAVMVRAPRRSPDATLDGVAVG